mmetsp:Transcript_47347/g.34642  ORF Transcript_47347/g.34642 Transcript_47347/m.34642 type:complete len:86 (+) Transcript_47347:1-258(+)
MEQQNDGKKPKNPKHVFSFMKKLLPKYFDGEWSYAQFRIQDSKALCAFTDDAKTLIVVTTDGNFYMASIPPKGGDCVQLDKRSLA